MQSKRPIKRGKYSPKQNNSPGVRRKAIHYYKSEKQPVKVAIIIGVVIVACLLIYFCYKGCEKAQQRKMIDDHIENLERIQRKTDW